jgi:hypothetical protein
MYFFVHLLMRKAFITYFWFHEENTFLMILSVFFLASYSVNSNISGCATLVGYFHVASIASILGNGSYFCTQV